MTRTADDRRWDGGDASRIKALEAEIADLREEMWMGVVVAELEAEVEQLREALKASAQALAEASTELDAAGYQRAASYAHQQHHIAWEAALNA
jgi:uncharacterized protein YukE